MKKIKITKGHNLKIEGVPSTQVSDIKDPEKISFHPSSIKNFKTKLIVKEKIRFSKNFFNLILLAFDMA